MSHDERQLQDYLDGRMTAEERTAFEARLDREPELAAKVAAGRALGAALRESRDDERLSPNFYARARERFEARSRPAGLRMLSWEAAGLAAAAMLIAVIVLPLAVRRDQGESLPDTLAKASGAASEPSAVAQSPAADDEVADEASRTLRSAEALLEESANKREAGGADRAVEGARADAAVTEEPPPAAPAAAAAAPAEARSGQSERASRGAAVERSETPVPARGRALAKRQAAPPPQELQRQKELRDSEITGVPLVAGSVAAGEVRVTTRGTGAVVLVGPRDRPFSCVGIRLEVTAEVYRLLLPRPTNDAAEAVHGCAVPLPAVDRAVEVVDPGADDE